MINFIGSAFGELALTSITVFSLPNPNPHSRSPSTISYFP